jgi:hypothetical protein
MRGKTYRLVMFLILITFAAIGCESGGGDSGGGGNACDGPVPCLTTHWNNVNYTFREANGNTITVLSRGNAFAAAGFTDEGDIISLGGPSTDCYNGILNTGGLDYDHDGEIDYWFNSVSGNVNICDMSFRITNLVLDGDSEDDVVATYIGPASVYNASEILPEILFEVMDKIREEY